jgi:hypothetical protein
MANRTSSSSFGTHFSLATCCWRWQLLFRIQLQVRNAAIRIEWDTCCVMRHSTEKEMSGGKSARLGLLEKDSNDNVSILSVECCQNF